MYNKLVKHKHKIHHCLTETTEHEQSDSWSVSEPAEKTALIGYISHIIVLEI